jgi:hypothetical protein
MVQYAETQHALEKGIETISPEKGVELIEKWEESLNGLEGSGAKSILKDLGALKKALQAKEPDGDKITGLLKKLGQETSEIAEEAEGSSSDKLKDIGKGLSQAAG